MHLLETIEELYKQGELIDPSTLVGPPPWEEINDWFEEADFPYRFNKPDTSDFTKTIRLTLHRDGQNESISLKNLSSGEASIVRFMLMVHAAEKSLFFIKLLILDEPDAHLHASLISSFLRLLQRLVEQHGTCVIMSTLRVETVGFAPPGSVFVMRREHPRITPCDDKIRTIGMLSGNLFGMVLADKRPVFVEDHDDVEFHTLALSFLRESGQWPHALSPQFVPVSQWAHVTREKGGKGAVRKAVKTLGESGLVGMVSGILDLDEGEAEEGNVYVLDRYATENYLLDPIVVYAFLLDREQAPKIDFEVKPGEVGGLADLEDEQLQQIADAIISLYAQPAQEELGKELNLQRCKVAYSNGKRIEVPEWLLTERGHTLFRALSKIAPAARNRQELIKAWKRVRLVPVEFRAFYEKAIGWASEFEAPKCAVPGQSDDRSSA